MEDYKFNCTAVWCGEELTELIESLNRIEEKRECYNELDKYLKSDCHSRYMLSLRGLRRTGKTTMMIQALKDLSREDLEKACFIQIKNNPNSEIEVDSLMGLLKDIKYLVYKKKFKYIFIDEVTALKEFVINGGLLADMFAGVGKQNVKVVLSGTDSLSFQFVEDGSALGRQLSVHTSYIPFKDFSRLLGENDFDKFIEYGGTLVPETPDGNPNYTLSPFASPAAAGQYLDSAISQNILHSLQNKKVGERYSSLEPLIESGQLRKVINHIVAYVNVSSLFTEKGISDKSKIFRCPNLGQMRNIIKEHWEKHCSHTVPTISKEQFEDELLNQYYERLGFRTFQNLKNINDSQLHDIQKYLLALKVAQLIPNVNITLVQHIKTDGTPASEIEVENVTRDNVFTITQPGMRFSLNKEMLKILEENKIIVDKKEFISEVNSVKGRIMEDTVLSELIYATERWNNILKFKYNEANNRYLNFDVFKLNLRYKTITEDPITKKEKTKSYDKEIDMVIFDPLSDGYHLFEIKHTTEKLDLATEHMLSYKVEWAFNNALYGDIIDREVLYRGKNGVENNVRYRNVGDFLKTINNNMIGSIFSSLEENKDVENANIQYEWNEKTPDYTLWDR